MFPINLIFLYLVLLLFTIFISKKLKFYDEPDIRKIHTSKVFNTGGVIIYLFYLSVIYLFEYNYNIELIISIGFFICLVGFVDDRINLNPSLKIIFLIIPSIYLIFNDIQISDLGYYEYIGLLNVEVVSLIDQNM